MNSPRQTSRLKREILVRLIKAFYSEDFAENARLIPYQMRPKDFEAPYRCCVYKERAILRDRAIAGLGLSIEDTVNMATKNPAINLHVFDNKGSIKEGKDADFAVIDADFNVYMTVVEGNVVFKK